MTEMTTLDDYELSTRARNCLKNAGIDKPDLVRQMSDAELLRLPDIGRATLRELRKIIGDREEAPHEVIKDATVPVSSERIIDPKSARLRKQRDQARRRCDDLNRQVQALLFDRRTSGIDPLVRHQIRDVHNVLCQLVAVYEGLRRQLSDYSEAELLDELRRRASAR